MREQFEKLPEIAAILETDDSYFDESTNEYVSHYSFKTGYLNGAWYAFQERQKKIDKAIEESSAWHALTGNALGLKIMELLK